jgi:predicted NBD/HSP70 family sugar kinase
VCLALDIGGTKLALGLVDVRAGILARDQVANPRTADRDKLFGTLGDLVWSSSTRALTLDLFVDAAQVDGLGADGPPVGAEAVGWRGIGCLATAPGPAA